MADGFLLLRSLHLLFGVLWAGGAVYRGVVVERASRVDAGFKDRFFARSLHGPYMGATALGTVGFGVATLLQGIGAYRADSLGGGMFLFHGALGLAMLALVLGLAGHLPTDIRLKPLAQARLEGGLDAAGEAAYARLERREGLLGRASFVLIVGALLGMVFFRAFI